MGYLLPVAPSTAVEISADFIGREGDVETKLSEIPRRVWDGSQPRINAWPGGCGAGPIRGVGWTRGWGSIIGSPDDHIGGRSDARPAWRGMQHADQPEIQRVAVIRRRGGSSPQRVSTAGQAGKSRAGCAKMPDYAADCPRWTGKVRREDGPFMPDVAIRQRRLPLELALLRGRVSVLR